MNDTIALGTAPRPQTGEELAERITAAVLAAVPAGSQLHVQTKTQLAGADIENLHLSVSGEIASAQVPAPVPVAGEASKTPATLRNATLSAAPVDYYGTAVRAEISIGYAPITWIETDTASFLAITASETDPVQGSGLIGLPVANLARTVEAIANEQLRNLGASLSDLDFSVNSPTSSAGTSELSATLSAKVRKGFLSAAITGAANASIGPDLVLRIDHVQIAAANPIVAGMLKLAQGKLAELEGREIDLKKALPPGIRVTELSVTVTDEISLRAKLG